MLGVAPPGVVAAAVGVRDVSNGIHRSPRKRRDAVSARRHTATSMRRIRGRGFRRGSPVRATPSDGPPSADNRSYRVSFEKIRKHLPDFKCEWDARRGARQLHDLFKKIDLTAEVFRDRSFTRLKQLEYLIRTRQIDGQFFWTE